MMTELENFRATVEHRRPGRILYYASFTPDLGARVKQHVGDKDIGIHYGYTRFRWVGLRRPENLPRPDYSAYWKDEKLPEGTRINGFGVAEVPSGFYHFTGFVSPLRNAQSLSEIENYPLDDPSRHDASHMAGEVRAAHEAGLPTKGWFGHMYEDAWQIRGYEQFLMDMIERPEWAECLLERIAQNNRVHAIALAKAGVDWVQCGDDVANQNAMMFAPPMWREFIHSKWAKTWKIIKDINPDAKIKYHSDGNITAVLDDLVDAGLDVLNPVQPECLDVDAIHKRYGSRLTFDGVIGTQSTMPWGTPQDVRAKVKELIEKYGRNGGLILSPTHVLEPEVPLANIDAFADACREFGTFET
jgi:uroporphyrinogen decarboxylase